MKSRKITDANMSRLNSIDYEDSTRLAFLKISGIHRTWRPNVNTLQIFTVPLRLMPLMQSSNFDFDMVTTKMSR